MFMGPVFPARLSARLVPAFLLALLASGLASLSARAQVCGVLPDGQVVFADSTFQCTSFVPLAQPQNPTVTTTPTGPFTTGPAGPLTTPTGPFTTGAPGRVTTGSMGPFTTGPSGPLTTGPIAPVTPQMNRRR
jgi:hypothetical protein